MKSWFERCIKKEIEFAKKYPMQFFKDAGMIRGKRKNIKKVKGDDNVRKRNT